MKLNKKIYVIFLIVFFLSTGFGPIPFSDFSSIISEIKGDNNIIDKIYLAKKNPNVVDNFKFGIKEVSAAVDSAESEYMIDIGPINGSTTSGYVYASFFNPSSSGKTVAIKHIVVRANAVAAANYVDLTVRRTSAASGGTQITTANIPKKNTDSSNSVIEVRHTGVTTTLSGSTDSRIISQAMPGAAGQFHSIRDVKFEDNEKLILQPGEGIALYQEAAGDADERIRMYTEWEEISSTPSAQNEFIFTYPRVEVAATTNYVYNTFFNPAASGKTAIIKKIGFGTNTSDAAATTYQNISLRRITAASGGTAITASYIPKKHSSSSNSSMEFRRTNVTVTLNGTIDARLGMVTPGTTGYAIGWQEINFYSGDEYLIIQPGEGIALISEGTGDADQLTRMAIEWQEVSSANTPTSQGEYMLAFPRISDEASAPALNTTFYTFFNPAASGKTAVIKRLVIRNNNDTTSTYSAFNFRRLTAASGGVQIAAADAPKKHTGTSNPVTELRYCGTTCASTITATYAGTADSRLMTVNGPGAVGQVIGQREIVFGENEKLILQPGEGIGFYLDVLAGDIDHYIKIMIEWDEETTTPNSRGEYLIDAGPINGSTTSGYKYISMFNPAASGKTAIIKRLGFRIDTISTAVYIPMSLVRTTAASGGTQITTANIPKKHSGTANSAMEIRRTGVTTTLAGTADSRLVSFQTAGAAGSAIAPSLNGYQEFIFKNDEQIILQPGEGITLYQEAAGDADFRVKLMIEWEEVSSASTPTSEGEYLLSTGPVDGSLTSGYTYGSLFNPSGSNKNYILKRIGIKANRYGTITAPGYLPITIRKITAASGGTQIAVSNIPKKHSGTSNTTAEVRYADVTTTLAGETNSRLLGVTAPGAVNHFSDYGIEVTYGDELILKPGEGIALYQEGTAGDTLIRYRLDLEWSEFNAATPIVSISISDGGINYGIIPAGSSQTTISLSDSQVITNTGNVSEDFDIKGLATTTGGTCTHWTILESGTPGANQYAHEWSINNGTNWNRFTDTYEEFVSNKAVSGTTTLDLRITIPSVSDCLTAQNVDVTIQASAH